MAVCLSRRSRPPSTYSDDEAEPATDPMAHQDVRAARTGHMPTYIPSAVLRPSSQSCSGNFTRRSNCGKRAYAICLLTNYATTMNRGVRKQAVREDSSSTFGTVQYHIGEYRRKGRACSTTCTHRWQGPRLSVEAPNKLQWWAAASALPSWPSTIT